MEEQGVKPAHICQLLGHSTIETTYRYYFKKRENPRALKKAVSYNFKFLEAV